MPAPHSHGHIEFNWLTEGHMDYVFDGGSVTVEANRLVAFWAGIPHQTVDLREIGDGKQLNIYLPMDAFLEMPQLGRLTETLMGGGVIQLTPDCIGLETLERWHGDYRSGNSLRSDLVRAEIATMFRRAAITGWDTLLPAWLEKSGTRTRTATPFATSCAWSATSSKTSPTHSAPKTSPKSSAFTPTTRRTSSPR